VDEKKTEEGSTVFNRGGIGRFVVAREADHGRWQLETNLQDATENFQILSFLE